MVDFVSIHLGEWRDLSQDLDRDTRTTFRDICEMFWRLDGHMEDNDQRNARTFDMSVQAYRKHKRRLLDMGKIELREGLIWCEYAQEKLNKIQEKSEKARNNINKRWHKNDANPLETNKTEDTDVHTNSLTRKPLSLPDRGSARARITNPADLRASDFPDVVAGIDVEFELAKFRDWTKANARRHKDASAAFRNWLRTASKYQARAPTVAMPIDYVALEREVSG